MFDYIIFFKLKNGAIKFNVSFCYEIASVITKQKKQLSIIYEKFCYIGIGEKINTFYDGN